MRNKRIVCLLLAIVMVVLTVNINSYAATLPELRITSNNYSVGDKFNLDEINNVEVEKTLQLYAVIAYGNDIMVDNNPDSLGWFVDETNLSGIMWTSSDTGIATVDNTGKVTGISEGTATITAKYDEYYDTNYQITVKSANESSDMRIGIVDKDLVPQPAMVLNKTHAFGIYLYDIPDTEKENIKVTINNQNIAELTGIDLCEWEDGSGKGMIIANAKFLALGTAKITATLDYKGKTYSDSYDFTVVESMYKLSLSSKKYTDLPTSIEKGDKIQLTATFEVYGGSLLPEDVTSNGVIWTSNNEKVATVDSKGLVTGTEEGTATITAKYKVGDETLVATCNLKVKDSTKSPINPGNASSSNEDSTTSKDTTVANGVLPQTGINMTIAIVSIIVIALISIFLYKKYNNYKDLK